MQHATRVREGPSHHVSRIYSKLELKTLLPTSKLAPAFPSPVHYRGRSACCAFDETTQSPAVLAKLCSCSGALIAEMPYAAVVPRGGSSTGEPRRPGGTGGGGGGGGPGGRAGVEESLGNLLRALARLTMDVAAEPSARIAGAWCVPAAGGGYQ